MIDVNDNFVNFEIGTIENIFSSADRSTCSRSPKEAMQLWSNQLAQSLNQSIS